VGHSVSAPRLSGRAQPLLADSITLVGEYSLALNTVDAQALSLTDTLFGKRFPSRSIVLATTGSETSGPAAL